MSRAETPTCVSTSDQFRSGYTAVNELMNIIVFREREREGGGREGEREGDEGRCLGKGNRI